MDLMNIGPNDWVTCPFDPVHRLKYSRFHNHFVACKKKHPDDRRRQCPYNFSEMIEPEQYEKHVSECPYRSLYINMGHFTQLPEYNAPSHFDIIDNYEEPMRKKSHSTPTEFVDSDEEFDSVSMAADDRGAFGRYFPRKSPLNIVEPPAIPASVSSSVSSFSSVGPTEKRGFGRGEFIRQMMERSNAASRAGSSRAEESPRSPHNSSSDFSNDERFAELIEPYKKNPLLITRDFGRGRGAIFKTLLRD